MRTTCSRTTKHELRPSPGLLDRVHYRRADDTRTMLHHCILREATWGGFCPQRRSFSRLQHCLFRGRGSSLWPKGIASFWRFTCASWGIKRLLGGRAFDSCVELAACLSFRMELDGIVCARGFVEKPEFVSGCCISPYFFKGRLTEVKWGSWIY